MGIAGWGWGIDWCEKLGGANGIELVNPCVAGMYRGLACDSLRAAVFGRDLERHQLAIVNPSVPTFGHDPPSNGTLVQ